MRCGTEGELVVEFVFVAARGMELEIHAGAIRSICEFGKRRRLEAATVCGVQMCIFAGAIHQAGDRGGGGIVRLAAVVRIVGRHVMIIRLECDMAVKHAGLRVPALGEATAALRSAERRVGKECVSKCRSLWLTDNQK